jgi:hypothetical protein
MTVNVYEQYFAAEGTANGAARRGALVMLISDSDAGQIRYEAAVTFFPHRDDEDFAVSYDAYASEVLYEAKGRRSKKREAAFLADLRAHVDGLAARLGCKVLWDKPLRGERRG